MLYLHKLRIILLNYKTRSVKSDDGSTWAELKGFVLNLLNLFEREGGGKRSVTNQEMTA